MDRGIGQKMSTNLIVAPAAASTPFFVTGGTVPATARSYVERQADRDLLTGLRAGDFCYVLTSRQMGKSSLMVRTANKLRDEGVSVAVLDLTAIGQNVTPEQWYNGIIQRLGRQLKFEEELEDSWVAHAMLGPCQRLFTVLREGVLPRLPNARTNLTPTSALPGRLVIFVDEIDAVRSLKFSTDEFFAAIRECFNRRPEDPEFNRLTFCLLGVATPADLIRDPRTTPFNIGRRILLSDFTQEEAASLSRGLEHSHDGHTDITPEQARVVLDRILHWTGGQPFLTQRFCRSVQEHNDRTSEPKGKIRTAAAVDALCRELFFSHRSRETDDNLHFVRDRLLKTDVDRAGMLDTYRRVRNRKVVEDDETNPLINTLRLSGIVRAREGRLILRNRIYKGVFDDAWIKTNTPESEQRRQKEAERRGVARGVIGAVIALALAFWAIWIRIEQRKDEHSNRIIDKLISRSGSVPAGLDHCTITGALVGREITVDFQYQITNYFRSPDHLRSDLWARIGDGELFQQTTIDGGHQWITTPELSTYIYRTNPPDGRLRVYAETSHTFGQLSELIYFLIRVPEAKPHLISLLATRKLLDENTVEEERLLHIQVRPDVWLKESALTNTEAFRTIRTVFPIERMATLDLWLNTSSGAIRRGATTVQYDGTPFPVPLPSGGSHTIRLDHIQVGVSFHRASPGSTTARNEFRPPFPRDARPGPGLDQPPKLKRVVIPGRRKDLPPPGDLNSPRALIPERQKDTPRDLLNLDSVFNAALNQTWHTAWKSNDLSTFPTGVQTILGESFDIRGVVQLSGIAQPFLTLNYPASVRGIPVATNARRLHFLHSTGWRVTPGRPIAHYLIRYRDGSSRVLPVVYGYHVRDWYPQSGESPAESTGLREYAVQDIAQPGGERRLYVTSWENPQPDLEIAALDFVSEQTESAPFLLAITVEQ